MVTVMRYRVKSLNGLLNRQARAVNFVWNFCNDTQKHSLKWRKKWPTGFDLNNLTAGTSKDLGLHSGTVNAVCEQYAKSRKQHNRPYLRYRGRKSLAWIPLKGCHIKELPQGFHFHGRLFRMFKSRPLPSDSIIRDGTNFSRDTRGNWFLNVVVEHEAAPVRDISTAVGVDLGLKTFATLSTGETIDTIQWYRNAETELATAQRARKKRRVRAIQARTANRRADFQHKASLDLVRRFDLVVVGNVSAKNLAKTNMAKSVLDASWSSFRQMLAYKAVKHGAQYLEVNEAFSTQTCSTCGVIPESRPKGIAGLCIRTWECSDCGASHDRDVNAAKNILRFGCGHAAPSAGILAL